ncbi:DoxX family protein [soil metagenome]
MFSYIKKCLHNFRNICLFLSPVGDLVVRLYIANIFFMSGLVKITSWESTLMLFADEYKVPLLSPLIAAFLGTTAELILPPLLVLGLGGRVMVLMFLIYNAMNVAFYPYLWTTDGALGLSQHVTWGLLLIMLLFHGMGKLSLDYLICKICNRQKYKV